MQPDDGLGDAISRFHQFLFCVSLVGCSWLMMIAIHEFGHVVGAVATGGQIQKVVLHPLTISSTTVEPNPNPALVVWRGHCLDV